MKIPDLYISFDADDVDKNIELASLNDDAEEIRRLTQSIDKANEIWKSWTITTGGSTINLSGSQGRIKVGADHVEELLSLKEQYSAALDSAVSVGVGLKVSEADKALLFAKSRGGGQVCFYAPEIEKELQDKENENKDDIFTRDLEDLSDDLGKSEHPMQSQFQAIIDDQQREEYQKLLLEQETEEIRKVKSTVVGILQQVKENAKELEDLKGEAPHLYESIMSMTQALILMARQLTTPKQDVMPGGLADNKSQNEFDQNQLQQGSKEEAEEHTDNPKIAQEIAMDHLTEDPNYYSKAEQPWKAKHWIPHFPVGFMLPTGPNSHGKRGGGKIKVMTVNGKTQWRSVRSGLVMDPNGIPTSSRHPGGSGEGEE